MQLQLNEFQTILWKLAWSTVWIESLKIVDLYNTSLLLFK